MQPLNCWALVAWIAVPAIAAPEAPQPAPADVHAGVPTSVYVSVFPSAPPASRQTPDQRWLAANAQVAHGGMGQDRASTAQPALLHEHGKMAPMAAMPVPQPLVASPGPANGHPHQGH